MKNNLVSIITPLYNSDKFIAKTIKSVLNQTYQNWEMIIVDDCSNDNSVNIVEKFSTNNKKIKLIKLNHNSGPAVARNKAIAEANGKYIAFLDSDDMWLPKKLEKQISFMEDNDYHFTFTSFQKIDEYGNKKKIIKAPERIDYNRTLIYNPIGCSTVIYDSDVIGKIYMPIIRKRQDYALWLKILKKINFGYGLKESLTLYRVRSNSISSNKINLIRYQWKLYREIENLSYIKSLFYLTGDIASKLFNIK